MTGTNSLAEADIALRALALTIEHAPRLMFVCDCEGRVLAASRAARNKVRVAPGGRLQQSCASSAQLVEKTLRLAVRSSVALPARLQFKQTAYSFRSWRIEPLPGLDTPLVMFKSDPETSLAAQLAKMNNQREADRKHLTLLKQEASRLRTLSETDRLTGLFNQVAFEKHCRDRLSTPGAVGVLAFIDLDDFKPVNDRFGHDAGDHTLTTVAGRLRQNIRDDDLLGRLGGDEFGIWFQDLDRDRLPAMLRRIRDTLSRQIGWTPQIGGTTTLLRISASIGTAAFPDDARDFESLRAVADMRMYALRPRQA